MISFSRRQKRFIEFFVESGQAVASVIKAGYSLKRADRTVAQFMNDPHILAAIEARSRTTGISKGEALMRLSQIGRGSMQSFLQLVSTPTSEQVHIDLTTEEAQENLHLIKSVTQQRYTMQTENGPVEVVETGVELHCPITALDHILRLLGQYPAQKYDYTTNGKSMSMVVDIARVAQQLGIGENDVARLATALNAAVQALPDESGPETANSPAPAAAAN